MGWMGRGPGYTVRDLVYWSGLIAGAVAGYGILAPVGDLHPLVRLLGMLACGVACGFLCETVYVKVVGPASAG